MYKLMKSTHTDLNTFDKVDFVLHIRAIFFPSEVLSHFTESPSTWLTYIIVNVNIYMYICGNTRKKTNLLENQFFI